MPELREHPLLRPSYAKASAGRQGFGGQAPPPSDMQLSSPEAVLGVHRNALQPEVRQYADNLRDQVVGIFKTNGVRNVEEFIAAARAKTITKETVHAVDTLLERLAEAVGKNETPEVNERRGKELLESAIVHASAIRDPLYEARALCDIAVVASEGGHDPAPLITRAYAVARSIERANEQCQALTHLAKAETVLGHDPQPALGEAKAVALANSTQYFDREWSDIALAEARAGLWEEAMRTIEHVLFATKDEILHDFGVLAAEKGDMDHGEKILGLLTRPKFRVAVQNALGKAEIRSGKDATNYFFHAKDEVTNITDFHERDRAWQDLAIAAAESGLTNFAASIVPNMRIKDLQNYVRSAIALAFMRQGKQDFAHAAVTAITDNSYTTADTLHRIAVIEVEKGLDVSATLDAAKDAARKIDNTFDAGLTFVDIAVVEAKAGHDPTATVQEALAQLALQVDEDNRALTFRAIATAEAGMRRFAEARVHTRFILREDMRAEALRAIGLAEAEAGIYPGASFAEAHRLLSNTDETPYDLEIRAELTTAEARAGVLFLVRAHRGTAKIKDGS